MIFNIMKHINLLLFQILNKTSGGEYEKKTVAKDAQTRKVIEKAVGESVLFASLRPEEKQECVDAFDKVEKKDGEKIIVQGSVGNDFYVVISGHVNVFVEKDGNEMKMGSVVAGNSFGELALMYNTPRQATIKCSGDCVFYSLNRKDFRGESRWCGCSAVQCSFERPFS